MMRPVLTIARRDLKALFDHPTGYILLVVFVGVTNFLYFGQVFLMGAATLRPMLDLLPWIFLFFVPAVTMRALAEDARAGTLEVVLAQPVTEAMLLAGKYAAYAGFIWIALALTLPVPLALSLGADLQVGVIVAQYVGTALLAAGLAGVGVWASSITPNQITAFMLGLVVMFALILAGLSTLVTGLPPGLATVAANLSVLPHFENIARGVIDLRDAVYFLTLAAVFLSLAYAALQGRRLARAGQARKRLRLGTALLVATLVVVNLFGRHIGGRLDLTPGKVYTLSRATKNLLRGLDDLVTITFYVSDQLPPQIALLERDIRDLLDDFRAAGGGRVRVVRVNPDENDEAAQEARTAGIMPVQFNVVGQGELQVKEGFLGLAVRFADQVETVPFIQRTDDLEYQLASYIRSLTRVAKPVVGIMEADGERGAPAGSYERLREALRQQYEVRTLSPTDSAPISDSIKVLVAIGSPFFLTDSQAARINAFLDRGGGALIMAAGMGPQPQGFMASPRPVGWNRITSPYGVTVQPNLVYDLVSNERVQMGGSGGFRLLMSYPFWVRAMSTGAATVNRDIEAVSLPWASALAINDSLAKIVTPLLVTTQAAGVESGTAFIHPQRDYPRDSLAVRVLAALVNPLAADSVPPGLKGRLVVVGNSDFVNDRQVEATPEGLIFALNAVDWLAEDDELIAIRSKDRRPPPLQFESATARDLTKWGNVAGVPGLVIVGAGLRLLRRRRRTKCAYSAQAGDRAA